MKDLWIKICGVRDEATLTAAVAAGANAVGFVFAWSPREIGLTAACALKDLLPDGVVSVAVMYHPEPAFAEEVVETMRPDYLQTDAADFAKLTLAPGCRELPVFRSSSEVSFDPGRFLFEGAKSGSGERCDWTAAASLATRGELVLAGGLEPGNVASAIEQVRPFGVDVSSGVESSPGHKDPALIRAFVDSARTAVARLDSET